jgi:hypothetical protein
MKRIFRKHPSPAMVVAIVALIVALTGTAVGAVFITKKQAKKIAKNQANNEISKRAPGLAVASANTANNADRLDGLDASQLRTRSAYAERTADLPLTASFQDVVTTSVTTTGTRIVATTSLELDAGGGSNTAHCRLRIAGVESFTYDDQALPTESTMALTFARTVPPGTHAVGLECSETGTVIADDAALSVVAVGE